jgi:hypothetical protein
MRTVVITRTKIEVFESRKTVKVAHFENLVVSEVQVSEGFARKISILFHYFSLGRTYRLDWAKSAISI